MPKAKSLEGMRTDSLHARSQRLPDASIHQNNSTWTLAVNCGTYMAISLTEFHTGLH